MSRDDGRPPAEGQPSITGGSSAGSGGDAAAPARAEDATWNWFQGSGQPSSPGHPSVAVEDPSPSSGSGVFLPRFGPGDVLAERYEIRRFIAKGGMGEVYEAEDLELGERVAVKTVRAEVAGDEAARERFRREIQLSHRVTHPNVCRIFDLRRHTSERQGEPPTLFFTMEFLAGETLAERLRREGAMTPEEALPLAGQMIEGLAAAHRAGVIHRDFNPRNVMLVPEGAGSRVVITDFGLAHAALAAEGEASSEGGDRESARRKMQQVTATGVLVGTPAYMAPEQIEGGELTPRTDLYAFGCLLFELVTGTWPFRGDSPLTTAMARLHRLPPSPRLHAPELDVRWERVILRCLEPRSEDRFATASEIFAALAGHEAPGPPPSLRRRRRAAIERWWPAAAGLLLLLTALVTHLWLREPEGPRQPGQERPRVAVLGFKNLAGDERTGWLSTAFSEMLATELAAAREVQAVPGEIVARAKLELALADDEVLSPDNRERLRKNLGVRYLVVGSYSALGERGGDRLRLDLRLEDGESGEILAALAEEGVEAELFDLVARAGARLREHLGAGALSQDERRRVAASQPSSPEAARLYAEGLARLRRFDTIEARDLLVAAVAAEPGFPLAHTALAEAWAALGHDARAATEAERAFELSTDLPRPERMLVEARYHEAADRWEEAVEIYRSLWRFYPDNLEFGLRLAGAETRGDLAPRALETIAALRRLPGEDPRIDLAEAEAARSTSDFERQLRSATAAATAAERRGARLLLARARVLRGLALRHLGRIDEARQAYAEARGIYIDLGDRGGDATAANGLAVLEHAQGNGELARELYLESLATSREIGDERGTARALNNLAILERWQGDGAGARHLYTEALEVFRRIGDAGSEARTLSNLANLLTGADDLEDAQGYHNQALALQRQRGDQLGVVVTLSNLGGLALKRGDLRAAEEAYGESSRLAAAIGAPGQLAYARLGEASVRLLRGEPRVARKSLLGTLEMARPLGERTLEGWLLWGLGEAELTLGEEPAARQHLEEALALHRSTENRSGTAEALRSLALLELGRGQGPAALAAAAEGGELAPVDRDPLLAASLRVVLARAQAAAGQLGEAWTNASAAWQAVAETRRRGERLRVLLPAGQVAVSTGHLAAGKRWLEESLAEARELGYLPHRLEASLALLELDLLSASERDRPALLAGVSALAAEAEERGMLLLARRARRAAGQHPDRGKSMP